MGMAGGDGTVITPTNAYTPSNAYLLLGVCFPLLVALVT